MGQVKGLKRATCLIYSLMTWISCSVISTRRFNDRDLGVFDAGILICGIRSLGFGEFTELVLNIES